MNAKRGQLGQHVGWWLVACAAVVCVLTFAPMVRAESGALDPSFGMGGVTVTPVGLGYSFAADVAIQPSDGRIVATGFAFDTFGTSAFIVARYLTDGSVDTSFHGTGFASAFANSTPAVASALTIQPNDGKIVVVGTVGSGHSRDAAIVRFLPDGTLDASFGSGGIVVTNFGADDPAGDVAIDVDGNIVVGGGTGPGGPPYLGYVFLVARYLENGALDPAFGSGGFVTTGFPDAISNDVSAIVIQPTDGKIVAVGRSFYDTADGAHVALARYMPNGTLDTEFGIDGRVTTAFNEDAVPSSVLVQPDGKILLSGVQGTAGFYEAALLRYLPVDGSLDPSFGTGGKVTVSVGGSTGVGVALQADGKIVQVGEAYLQGRVMVNRFLPDGRLDATFGSACGVFLAPIEGSAYGVDIQSDGNIVTAGQFSSTFGVARVLGGTSEPSTSCPGAPCAPAAKHRLVVKKLLAPGGDERLALSGEAVLPSTVGFDPSTTETGIMLADDDTTTIVDATIPSGAYDPASRAGWKTNKAGTTWTYKNRGSHPQGITSVVVRTTHDPNGVRFKVKGVGTYPAGAAALPVHATLTFADACIAATWSAMPPAAPSCVMPNPSTLSCK
ncbi:MAG TPA: hypothetical protein VGR62_23965 [Candidatus Binatia bacterium]|jgi:uncharacterized delta-60 repeat protein|nr:hypothetical protein [Candidatus Binatia bacterium]